MNARRGIGAWKVPRGIDLALLVDVASDQILEPDLRVEIVSQAPDSITVQVVEGEVPDDPTEVLFIADRGAFVVARRFWWPAVAGRDLLLTLVPPR